MRQLRIYLDCSGAVYNALKFAYDGARGEGDFGELVRQTFWELPRIKQPAGYFPIDFFGDKRWATSLGTPSVEKLAPGDVVVLYSGEDTVHSMLISDVNLQEGKIVILQSTDETENQGVHLTPISIENPSRPLEEQPWQELINQQTIIYRSLAGQSFSVRLSTPGSYNVFRLRIW